MERTMDKNIKYTDFLFARPSFWEGMGRVIDFGNALQEYNTSSSGSAADERALKADWQAVGEDMRKAMGSVGKKS